MILMTDVRRCVSADHGAGAPARRDAPPRPERRRVHQVVRLAQADALLLRPEESGRPAAAVDPDGRRQVQLRLRVPRGRRQARPDAAHRPLLPDDDAGPQRTARRITLRSVTTLNPLNVQLGGSPFGRK